MVAGPSGVLDARQTSRSEITPNAGDGPISGPTVLFRSSEPANVKLRCAGSDAIDGFSHQHVDHLFECLTRVGAIFNGGSVSGKLAVGTGALSGNRREVL